MYKEVAYHSKHVSSLKWSSDGQYLGTASVSDKVFKIGQLDSSGNVKSVQTVSNNSPNMQISFCPADPTKFCTITENAIEIWDIRANKPTSKLQGLSKNLFHSWSPNGKYITVSNNSNWLLTCDIYQGKQIKKQKFNYEINEFTYSNNSDYILIAVEGDDQGCIDIIHLHDTDNTMELIEKIPAHASKCVSLKTDLHYRKLAVGGTDLNMSIWDMDNLVCQHMVPFESTINRMTFSGDGQYIAVAPDSSEYLHIVNTNTGKVTMKVDIRYSTSPIAWHPIQQSLIAIATDSRSLSSSSSSSSSSSLSIPAVRLLQIPSLS